MSMVSLSLPLLAMILWFYIGSLHKQLRTTKRSLRNALVMIEVELQERLDLVDEYIKAHKMGNPGQSARIKGALAAHKSASDYLKNYVVAPTARLNTAAQLLLAAEAQLKQASHELNIPTQNTSSDGYENHYSEKLHYNQCRLNFAKQGFNELALNYQRRRQQFPGRLASGLLGVDRSIQVI